MGFGGYLGGVMFDHAGDYLWSFHGAAIAGVINLVFLAAFACRIRRRRVALTGTIPAG